MTELSDEELRGWLAGKAFTLLSSSAFRRVSSWPSAVVVLRRGAAGAEEQRVTSRADFAHFLRANDLESLARECMHRKIARGAVLCFIENDDEAATGTGFVVVDIIAEAHAARARAAATPSSEETT